MKIILVDPDLVRTIWVIIFLILVMVCALENNYSLVHTKLGYLWYSVFLNVPINHIQEKQKQKQFHWKRKKTFFTSTSFQLQHWKNKDNDFLQLCFLSLYLFRSKACIFYFFYLQIHVRIIN